VPLSIKEAGTLVDAVVEMKPSTIKGYSLYESSSEYAGVEQRWLLVESEQRRIPALHQLGNKIEKHQQKAQQELKQLFLEGVCLCCRS
jgi:transposase